MDTAGFQVKDCALITRVGGVPNAMNLRELRERVSSCPPECLFHHFHETLLRPSFDHPEFRNDFALWAARDLRDRALGERLGILNPYRFADLEELRSAVLDILDDRLAELPHVPWVPKGREFHLLRAVTVVFDTGVVLHTPPELAEELPRMSLSSVYYHFVEARRRTPGRTDDFSAWLRDLPDPPGDLLRRLARIDFYWMTLRELRERLVQEVRAEGASRG